MKLCLMCDLHLPSVQDAMQYDVLRWAVERITVQQPDAILFAGDVTCDGNEAVYDFFLETMRQTNLPFLYVPGNSDLRCAESRDSIYKKTSDCENHLGDLTVFAVNDSDGTVSDATLACLDNAKENSIVFLHHPLQSHSEESAKKLLKWRKTHKAVPLFYGHSHRFSVDGATVCLQAMDPDKAIGESPCITYYDTETKELQKEAFACPIPSDLCGYLGISCFHPVEQIDFATERGLKYLELRPNCIHADAAELQKAVERWRRAGGEQLSIHLPDIAWEDGALRIDERLAPLLEIVSFLKAERVTQHVPKVSVREMREDPQIMDTICAYLTERWNAIPHDLIIGVENMHMNAKEASDDTRRFGYLPQECLQFMQSLACRCRHRVGINFDFGHARNNAPFSQTYQIGTWLAMVGSYAVGYHVHQIVQENGRCKNHMPITDVYGRLISYASFFRYWSQGRVAKAPLILEMRPDGAYEQSLRAFREDALGEGTF